MNQALIGLPLLILLAWLTGSDRRHFPLKLVLTGLGAQVLLAVLLLKIPLLQELLLYFNRMVLTVEAATREGTSLVFGFLGGAPPPFEVSEPGYSFVLAFRALPIIIVFAALSALLWHWRVIPLIVGAFARLLTATMGLSGAVSVGSASTVFVGMVESPLLIKPYLDKMTAAELFMLMTCGMATVAGTVMGLYAGILASAIPDALSHILVASLISAPAAILLAAVMMPPVRDGADPAGDHGVAADTPPALASPYSGSMDAIVTGTGEGLRMLGNIIGMLIVFVALVFLVNRILGLIPVTGDPLTLVGLFGTLMTPLAWLLGIPWGEAQPVGELLATKLFVNELVAYLDLAALAEGTLGERSRIIATYALCGFANFGSLGIMIGGMSTLCPSRRGDILRLAPRSVWAGFLATCMTAAVVGVIY